MNPIAIALSHVTLGLETSVRGLTMFPLLGREHADEQALAVEPLAPLTLDEALSSGWARITEISESGSVPELRFVNQGTQPVFILDGEELVGAKQNRIVNLSLLVPGSCSLTIPVSCVEAGRWHARSRSFSAAPRVQYGAGRAKRTKQVTMSMLCSGRPTSDQGAVWDDISAKARRLHSSSETSAMEAMFVQHAGSIDEFVEGLSPVPGQVGALFTIGGRIAGLDLFASAVLLRKLMPKIVRSHALDAIDPDIHKTTGSKPRSANSGQRVAAEQFLKQCGAVPAKEMPALGLGRDLRVDGDKVHGAALVHDDQVVHFAAFKA